VLNEEEEDGCEEEDGGLSHQEADEEAEEAREASLIDGTDKTKINREALSLYKEGELRPSALHFRKALQLDDAYKEAHNGLAVTLIDLGRPAEALAHAREAVELDGMYKFAHKNCGLALVDLGDYDGAVQAFSAALKLQRGYKEAQKGLDKAKALKAAGSSGTARCKALGRTGLKALWWPGMYKEEPALMAAMPKGNNKQTLVFEGDALAGFNVTEAGREAAANVAASGFKGGVGCDGAVLHYIKAICKDAKYRCE
jgi:tetratricopeptide (TPR) repeat protein